MKALHDIAECVIGESNINKFVFDPRILMVCQKYVYYHMTGAMFFGWLDEVNQQTPSIDESRQLGKTFSLILM